MKMTFVGVIVWFQLNFPQSRLSGLCLLRTFELKKEHHEPNKAKILYFSGK